MAYRGFHDLFEKIKNLPSPVLNSGDQMDMEFKVGADDNVVRSSVLLSPDKAIERNRKNLELLENLMPVTGEHAIYPEIEPGENRTVPLLLPPYTTTESSQTIDQSLLVDTVKYNPPVVPQLEGMVFTGDELTSLIKQTLSPPSIVPIFALLFKHAHPKPTVKALTPTDNGLTSDVIDILYSGEFSFEIVSGIANLESTTSANRDRTADYQIQHGNESWDEIKANIKNAIIRSIFTVFKEIWEAINNPTDETVRDKLLEHKDIILNTTTRIVAEQLHSYFYSFGSISRGAYINGYGPMDGSNLLLFPGTELPDTIFTVNTGEDLSIHLQYNRYTYGLIVLDIVLSNEDEFDATDVLNEPAFSGEVRSYLESVSEEYLTAIIARLKNNMGNMNDPAEHTRNSFTNQPIQSPEKTGPTLDRHVLVGFEIDPGKLEFPDVSLQCNYVTGLNETENGEAYRSAYILSRQPIARNTGLVVDEEQASTVYHKLMLADRTDETEFGNIDSSTLSNLRYSQAIFLGGVFQNRFDFENNTVYSTLTFGDGTVVTPEELAAILQTNVFIGGCNEDKDATRQPVVIFLSGFKSIYFARRLLELAPAGLFVAATTDTVNFNTESDVREVLSYIGDAARIEEISGSILDALDIENINNTIKSKLIPELIAKHFKTLNTDVELVEYSLNDGFSAYLDGDISRNGILNNLFGVLSDHDYADILKDFTLEKVIDIIIRYGGPDSLNNFIEMQNETALIETAVELGIGFETLFGVKTTPPSVTTPSGPGTDFLTEDGHPEGELMEEGILSIVSVSELKTGYNLLRPDSEFDFDYIDESSISGSPFLSEWKQIFNDTPIETICQVLFTGKDSELAQFLIRSYGSARVATHLIQKVYGTPLSGNISYPEPFLLDAGLDAAFIEYVQRYIVDQSRINLALTWQFEDGNPKGIPTGFTGLHSILVKYIPSEDIEEIEKGTFLYSEEWFNDILDSGFMDVVRLWASSDSPTTKTTIYNDLKYPYSYGLLEVKSKLNNENTTLFGEENTEAGILLHSPEAYHMTRNPEGEIVEDYRANIGYVWFTSENTTQLAEANESEFEKLIRAMFSVMDYLCIYCARHDLNMDWRQ